MTSRCRGGLRLMNSEGRRTTTSVGHGKRKHKVRRNSRTAKRRPAIDDVSMEMSYCLQRTGPIFSIKIPFNSGCCCTNMRSLFSSRPVFSPRKHLVVISVADDSEK